MAQGEEVGREERGWGQGARWRGLRRARRWVQVGRDVWWGMAGRGKQKEGEVAVAPSPSYK
ncbi:hypothetical protein HMPREF1556_01218 [Porphyromonas sp. oral taxon 278 str. W7784]|nr:hypothetical protein HMPREF1556_01218 [Porphyromonas sp. oral taxon 278 str. W7784]